jgi:hypothetical protein
MEGFTFVSALELNMGYYHIKLDAALLGYHQPIMVFTEHKINTFNGLQTSDYIFCWLLLLKEY